MVGSAPPTSQAGSLRYLLPRSQAPLGNVIWPKLCLGGSTNLLSEILSILRYALITIFQILEQYRIKEQVPPPIQDYLLQGQEGNKPENPKPSDPIFRNVNNLIIASNQQAAQAALNQAQIEGLNSLLLTSYLQGEASQAGRFVASLARQIAKDGQPIPRPACIILGGETTVKLTGSGKGGRNQELALGAVSDLANIRDVVLVSLATDGGDGPTEAAGAVVTSETLTRARQANLSPFTFLANNDAYHFFQHLDDLIITGPTSTNVNDLVFLFAF